MEEQPITQEDYERLKLALAQTGKEAYRNVLIAKTLRSTGLRINEVMSLCRWQLYQDGPEIGLQLKRSKRWDAKWERLPITPTLGLELWQYCLGRGLGPNDAIWPIKPRMVRHIFAEASRIAGLSQAVHPHQLRALYATWLLDNGLPLAVASKLLGHVRTETTLKHYLRLDQERKRMIQERVPV